MQIPGHVHVDTLENTELGLKAIVTVFEGRLYVDCFDTDAGEKVITVRTVDTAKAMRYAREFVNAERDA